MNMQSVDDQRRGCRLELATSLTKHLRVSDHITQSIGYAAIGWKLSVLRQHIRLAEAQLAYAATILPEPLRKAESSQRDSFLYRRKSTAAASISVARPVLPLPQQPLSTDSGTTMELSPNFGDGLKDQAAAWA